MLIVFYKFERRFYNLYKILTSLSVCFIKAHIGFYNFKSGLRFLPVWSPYFEQL